MGNNNTSTGEAGKDLVPESTNHSSSSIVDGVICDGGVTALKQDHGIAIEAQHSLDWQGSRSRTPSHPSPVNRSRSTSHNTVNLVNITTSNHSHSNNNHAYISQSNSPSQNPFKSSSFDSAQPSPLLVEASLQQPSWLKKQQSRLNRLAKDFFVSGNTFFASGDYSIAIEAYRNCLHHLQTVSSLTADNEISESDKLRLSDDLTDVTEEDTLQFISERREEAQLLLKQALEQRNLSNGFQSTSLDSFEAAIQAFSSYSSSSHTASSPSGNASRQLSSNNSRSNSRNEMFKWRENISSSNSGNALSSLTSAVNNNSHQSRESLSNSGYANIVAIDSSKASKGYDLISVAELREHGSLDAMIADVLNNLAACYEATGRLDYASHLYEEVHAFRSVR